MNMMVGYPAAHVSTPTVHTVHTEVGNSHDDITEISPDDFIIKPPANSSVQIPDTSTVYQSDNSTVPTAVTTYKSGNERVDVAHQAVATKSKTAANPSTSTTESSKDMPKVKIMKPPTKSKSYTNSKPRKQRVVCVDIPALKTGELTMTVKGAGADTDDSMVAADIKIFMTGAAININGEPATVIFNKSVSYRAKVSCQTLLLVVFIMPHLRTVAIAAEHFLCYQGLEKKTIL